jgi:hypothetical protein
MQALDFPPIKSGYVALLSMGVAVVAVGAALQVNYGQYHPIGLQLLVIAAMALALTGRAMLRSKQQAFEPISVSKQVGRLVVPAMLAGAMIQFVLLMSTSPTAQPMSSGALLVFRFGVALAAVGCIVAVRNSAWRGLAMWLLPALHFLIGAWLLHLVPQPPVDVCVFQRDASAALVHGVNPYSIDFPNLYAHPEKVYDPAVVVDGRVKFGFPYPPVCLLWIVPGYLLGDFRWAYLIAMTLAGGMIMRLGEGSQSVVATVADPPYPHPNPLPEGEGINAGSRPGEVAFLAGMLFMFTPRGFFILEAGFTEPLVVMLLAAVMLAVTRRWKLLPVLFGLLLASKQYMVVAAPLGLLLLNFNESENKSGGLMPWLIAGATAALATVPLAAWDLPAFLKSVVLLQFHQPLRPDALSFLPGLIQTIHWAPIAALPFVLSLALIVLIVCRFPRNPASFAPAVGAVFLVFFATNKQAFCGYYLLVIGALCCALATADLPGKSSCPD